MVGTFTGLYDVYVKLKHLEYDMKPPRNDGDNRFIGRYLSDTMGTKEWLTVAQIQRAIDVLEAMELIEVIYGHVAVAVKDRVVKTGEKYVGSEVKHSYRTTHVLLPALNEKEFMAFIDGWMENNDLEAAVAEKKDNPNCHFGGLLDDE